MPGPSTDALPRPSGLPPVPVAALASGRGPVHGADVAVTGVTASSARVHPGDLFVGIPGRNAHGAAFAPSAVESGAVAVLTDPAGAPHVPQGVPALVVDDVRAVVGEVAADVYGRPSRSLRMLGVTGTSGKTTTTFLLRAALAAAGRTSGLIGTVATVIGTEQVQTGFTTPEAPDMQALLAVMVERGVTDVAMEVSSHALAMGRVGGIRYDVAAFLNLSEDHLDFHRDMDDYFAAKASLFDIADPAHAVVCVDDRWGARLAASLPSPITVQTRDQQTDSVDERRNRSVDQREGGWRALDVRDGVGGATSFRVAGPAGELQLRCAIPGRYNVANAVVALAIAHEAGLDLHDAAAAISTATVPGRMERIDADQPFLAVVDYSHKPAAVEGALRALRPVTEGRLIIVLGCGGDRDTGKRPHMGAIAARDADLLVVTDDNPRSEDPAAIRRAMLAGALEVPTAERGEVIEVGDRAEAIAYAVRAARPGDTVLVAGKGHETGQEVAGVVHPFDDRDVLRAAIEAA